MRAESLSCPPAVSVVIPTFNRRDQLLRALDALDAQTFPSRQIQVIVVDDGSTDGTYQAADTAKERYSFQLIVLRAKRAGPGGARNLGLACAVGETVLFTDSDCVPDRDWVTVMVRAVREGNPAVGGRVAVPRGWGRVRTCVNWIYETWLGGQGSHWRLWGFIPGHRLRTGNMAVRRSLAEEVGGFRCSGGFYGEDTEFGELLSARVGSVVRCRRALVWHMEDRGLTDYWMESLVRGVTTVRLVRSGAIRMRGLYTLPLVVLLALACLACGLALGGTTLHVGALATALYWGALCAYSLRLSWEEKDAAYLIALPVVALLLHSAYALGTLLGIMGREPPEKGRAKPKLVC